MLDPPRTTPREVDEAIAADEIRTAKADARAGIWGLIACFAFTPLLWWIAPRGSPWVLALSVMIVSNLVLCWWGATFRPHGKEWLLAISNTILLAIVAHMYTPFLAAPGMAAMSAMVMVLSPTRSRLTSGIVAMTVLYCLSVLGPWVLERVGVVAVTTTVSEHGAVLHAPAFAGDQTSTLVVGVLYVIGLVAGAALLAAAMRARERSARHRLHLQAWQLRQLVPR